MKKSKIIVPALGILAFSTAAAVTGTVAWFTANRSVTVSNTAITAYNPESGLKVVLSSAKGATISESTGSGSTAAAVEHGLLRDASVDFATANAPVVYRSVLNDAGAVSGFSAVTAAAEAGTAAGNNGATTPVSYYWCSIYTATFSLESAGSSQTYELFYDNTKLSANAGSSTGNIKNALRIGIYISKSSHQVITPFEAASTTSTYVKAEAFGGEPAAPVTGNYSTLGSEATGTWKMGELTGAGTVEAKIYTWFEGTDAACNNEQVDGQALAVSLGFKISEKVSA